MKKFGDLKKVVTDLEPEGQGRGIIMGVTGPLLLEPFYYIALYWVCNNMTNTVRMPDGQRARTPDQTNIQ